VKWGQARPRLRGLERAHTPFHRKKIRFEKIFKEKEFFAKSQRIYLESGRIGIKNGSN